MSDPRRLVDDDATALERLLLDAVRREVPRPEVSRRMRRGLGLGTLAGAAATIAPATAVAKTATSLWVVLGVAVAVGAGAVGLHFARTTAAPAKVAARGGRAGADGRAHRPRRGRSSDG